MRFRKSLTLYKIKALSFREHTNKVRGENMDYIGTREAAKKWGCSQSAVSRWCREGKICFVVKPEKRGGRWQIPANAECPKT